MQMLEEWIEMNTPDLFPLKLQKIPQVCYIVLNNTVG